MRSQCLLMTTLSRVRLVLCLVIAYLALFLFSDVDMRTMKSSPFQRESSPYFAFGNVRMYFTRPQM
jgi:hypothetical protein